MTPTLLYMGLSLFEGTRFGWRFGGAKSPIFDSHSSMALRTKYPFE